MRISVLGLWGLNTVGETPSFLLTEGDEAVLVDVGPGTTRQLARLGITVPQIDTFFISHVHADHILGAPYAVFARSVQARSHEGRVAPLRVVGSTSVHEALEQMLHLLYPNREFPYEKVTMADDESGEVKLGSIILRTNPADHTVPTLSARIRFQSGREIGYTADTLPHGTLACFLSGVDVLIAEAFGTTKDFGAVRETLKHSLARDAAELAAEVEPRFLLLFHMHERYFADPKRQEIVDEVRASYSGHLVFPIDLQSLDL